MWRDGRARGSAALQRWVYPALTRLWAGGFALAGAGDRAAARFTAWSTPGGLRVGLLAPHPDDETAGCGGVAALHRAAGDQVWALILTDGGRSRAVGLDPAALTARRAAEALTAAAALGLTHLEWIGLPEGAWPLDSGARAIGHWLRAARPDRVYAPSCVDFHPEHLRTARALAAALRALPVAERPEIFVYEVFVPLGPRLLNRVAAIDCVAATKAAALACYTSQARGLAPVPRRDAYLAHFSGAGRAAEGFCALPAARYLALLRAGDWTGRRSPYRGLRARPFTDPLAYLAGDQARARLAALIAP